MILLQSLFPKHNNESNSKPFLPSAFILFFKKISQSRWSKEKRNTSPSALYERSFFLMCFPSVHSIASPIKSGQCINTSSLVLLSFAIIIFGLKQSPNRAFVAFFFLHLEIDKELQIKINSGFQITRLYYRLYV